MLFARRRLETLRALHRERVTCRSASTVRHLNATTAIVERGHGHAPGSLTFKPIEDGQTIRGKLVGSTQLASGRFAMIDDGLGFSLVPWRPVIEKEIGREVNGVMRGGEVSWQLGRKLGLGI
jgi:hypothetical protein